MTEPKIPQVLIEGQKYSAKVWEDYGDTWFVEIFQYSKFVRSARFDTKAEAVAYGKRHADI